MGRFAAFLTAALGLLPTTLALHVDDQAFNGVVIDPVSARGLGDAACTAPALGYLACRRQIPPPCIKDVASQAVKFCSSYLSLTATSTTTTSKATVVTVTVTATATVASTVVTTSTSSTVTTATNTSTTTTTTTTSTTTAATSYVPPPVVTVKKRRGSPACPDLGREPLTRLPPAKLSSVCSCLGVTATTTVSTRTLLGTSTATASTTRTTTSTTTSTTVEISVLTTTTTTTTTVTSQVLATETAIVDYCSISYNGGGVTPGNTVIRPPGDLNAGECCTLCWNTPNCVASAVGLGYCQLLVKTSPLEGAPTSPQCPLGIENYTYLPGPGTLYRGPCSPGLN